MLIALSKRTLALIGVENADGQFFRAIALWIAFSIPILRKPFQMRKHSPRLGKATCRVLFYEEGRAFVFVDRNCIPCPQDRPHRSLPDRHAVR
jgi:hypothetical protein